MICGFAIVSAPSFAASDALIKGDISRVQYMELSQKLFNMQDENGDGTLTMAEKDATRQKAQEMMELMGKEPRALSIKARKDTTKAEFYERQEKIFSHLDINGDDVISEEERQQMKDNLKKLGK